MDILCCTLISLLRHLSLRHKTLNLLGFDSRFQWNIDIYSHLGPMHSILNEIPFPFFTRGRCEIWVALMHYGSGSPLAKFNMHLGGSQLGRYLTSSWITRPRSASVNMMLSLPFLLWETPNIDQCEVCYVWGCCNPNAWSMMYFGGFHMELCLFIRFSSVLQLEFH